MSIFFAAAADHTGVLVDLLTMLVAAKFLAEIFERLKQPAVVGEILAGVLIGPSLLNWVQPSEITATLAEIGVIFLLFTVGLETKPQAILRVGARALLVAVLGVIVPFIAGYLILYAWGGNTIEAMFVGAAMVATSVGITARVLRDLGLLDAPTARIIMGAAVIDDILGLLILSVVSGAASGSVDYLKIGITTVSAFAFTLFVAFVGAPILTRIAPRIERLRVGESFFVAGLILCLGLSVLASFIGVAAIIGAFLAGMALAEAVEENKDMHRLTGGVTEFLVPFFLVNIGMQLNLSVFRDANIVILALIITIAAILTKLVGCGAGAFGIGWRRMGQVGVGMIPRGEVGIVVAQIGLSLAVISDSLYGVVLFMAIATTLVAPPFLKILYSGEPAATDSVDANDAGGIVSNEDDLARLG
ncbi:MAG: cation:proton antiporter [Acidobacteriota bacterium]|nr:cation:proton antiporter [Acidobacteriota bacterium]